MFTFNINLKYKKKRPSMKIFMNDIKKHFVLNICLCYPVLGIRHLSLTVYNYK